jgi:hypothetical protein
MPKSQGKSRSNNRRDHPYKPANHGGSKKSANTSSGGATFYGADAVETDPRRIAQREKQISFGKNTIGYTRYCELVPRHARKPSDPSTPRANVKKSKRAFAGEIKAWRRQLHEYDQDDDGTMEEVAMAKIQKEQQQLQQQLLLQQQQSQRQQLLQQQAITAANAHTPSSGGFSSSVSRDDVFDDLDLTSIASNYGLTSEEIREAAKDDPSLLELLMQSGSMESEKSKTTITPAAARVVPAEQAKNDEEELVDYDFDDDDDLL